MGYRGKVEDRAGPREPRALSWTLDDIAAELGVAKVMGLVRALSPVS